MGGGGGGDLAGLLIIRSAPVTGDVYEIYSGDLEMTVRWEIGTRMSQSMEHGDGGNGEGKILELLA